MLLGGFLLSRRVARIMAENITAMDAEQGSVASLVTANPGDPRVLRRSAGLHHPRLGGRGIAMPNRIAKIRTVATILVAWVATLPLAASIAAGLYVRMKAIGL